jgi:hypothetical protein
MLAQQNRTTRVYRCYIPSGGNRCAELCESAFAKTGGGTRTSAAGNQIRCTHCRTSADLMPSVGRPPTKRARPLSIEMRKFECRKRGARRLHHAGSRG